MLALSSVASSLDRELSRRMAGPQRHRLLQGYPMPAMMPQFRRGEHTLTPCVLDHSRPLIVGVLPHSSCAPSVAGCGFCTFPHEQFRASEVRATVEAVLHEVRQRAPELAGRRVDALYFGGGTANLTPVDSFERLWKELKSAFGLDDAEISLEGAPAFFRPALLDVIDVPRKRVSLGVQSFDPAQLERMGRTAIGGPPAVESALRAARARGYTTSADMLINLPHQTRAEMLRDLATAVSLGFDQICLYHLVLFRGLGTAWARDRSLVESVSAEPYENWLACREYLLGCGYEQKSLTNFERAGGYRYEECSFHPEAYDAVGFGPSGISGFSDPAGSMAVKWLNEDSSVGYREAMAADGLAFARRFLYGEVDLQLLHATRGLSRLHVDRRHFRWEWEAVEGAGLVEGNTLTPKGMFYADSIAGLLAAGRVRDIRNGLTDDNESKKIHMG